MTGQQIGIVVLIIVIGVFVTWKFAFGKTKPINASITEEHTTKLQDNPYDGLREMALNVTAEQLQLELPDDKITVFGIVMDWEIGDGIVTLVAYQTGDVSMYLSSGGAIIGGGQHDSVRKVALPYVANGYRFIEYSTQTDGTQLPKKDEVQFYLLTNKGRYFGKETMANIENESSDWLSLFVVANKLITELRMTTENK